MTASCKAEDIFIVVSLHNELRASRNCGSTVLDAKKLTWDLDQSFDTTIHFQIHLPLFSRPSRLPNYRLASPVETGAAAFQQPPLASKAKRKLEATEALRLLTSNLHDFI